MENSITISMKDWNALKENIAKQEPAIMELKEIFEEQIKRKEDFIAKQDEIIQQLFKKLL